MKNRFVCSLLGVVLIMMSGNSFSQEVAEAKVYSQNSEKEADIRNRYNTSLGTFQFQIINSRLKPVIHPEVIELIDMNRSENEVTYVKYSEEIRIMILPKSMISKDFDKIETFIYIQD